MYMLQLLTVNIFWLLISSSESALLTEDGNITSISEKQSYTDHNNYTKYLSCKEDIITEHEYLVLENSSLLLPQNDKIYAYESYLIDNDTAYICVTKEDEKKIKKEKEVYNLNKEFLECSHILIENHEFELMENKTVYIMSYHKYYKPGDYYYIQERGVYVCIPDYRGMVANSTDPSITRQSDKFSVIFSHVTVIGLVISIISLTLHLVVFCLIPNARNLPGCCLASLSVSLLSAYLCFVFAHISSKKSCANLGLSIYYFFLTSFFWMNTIAFDVWRSFRVVVRELRISSHRVPWARYLLYSAYSWLIPAALAILAEIADATDILPPDYRPSFGHRYCWFGQRKALLVFFVSPLCLVMALNVVFFLDSAYVINRATIKTSNADKTMLTRRFFMFMRLALLMGLTWIIGIVAGYINNEFLWYMFVVLNTLQGLFIFIVFSCSSKMRISFILKLRGGENKRQSTSVRTISQASGAL